MKGVLSVTNSVIKTSLASLFRGGRGKWEIAKCPSRTAELSSSPPTAAWILWLLPTLKGMCFFLRNWWWVLVFANNRQSDWGEKNRQVEPLQQSLGQTVINIFPLNVILILRSAFCTGVLKYTLWTPYSFFSWYWLGDIFFSCDVNLKSWQKSKMKAAN